MKRLSAFGLALLAFATVFSAATKAQKQPESTKPAQPAKAQETKATDKSDDPADLVKVALKDLGGERYVKLTSILMKGSVDLYAPYSSTAVPGNFSLLIAGERQHLEIDASPVFVFRQIFDGERGYSSIPSLQCKFGLPLLAKFDQPGYSLTALTDKKKAPGFRIGDDKGNTADFFMDRESGRVASFFLNNNGYTCETELSSSKDFDGIQVPMNFSQRLDTQEGAFHATFKVREVQLDRPVDSQVFAIP